MEENLKKFREKFSSQHVDPPSPRSKNFDQRDMTRLLEDDKYASAFLNWKKQNIEDSIKLAADVFEWRKKNNVNDLSPQDISDEFYSKQSMFIHGRCNDGNRVVYFIGKRFTKDEEAQGKKLFMFLLEQIQREDAESKVTFILDAGECGMSNVDLGLIRLIVDSFMYYFPSLLGRTYIVDLPGILTAIWNVVKVWFDDELRSRTHHCARKELEKCVDIEHLPEALGGTSKWQPTKLEDDISAEFSKGDESFADAVENLQINEN